MAAAASRAARGRVSPAIERHALAAAILAVALAGCTAAAEPRDPSASTAGVVTVGGRAGPLTAAAVEGLDGVAVEATDETDGLARLCRREVDVVDVGRAPDPAELQRCRDAGLEVVPLTLGAAADVLAVGPLTAAPDCLAVEQAEAARDGATTWAQLDPELPDAPLSVVGERAGLTGPADDVALARQLPALGERLLDLQERVRTGWAQWAGANRAVGDALRARAGRDAVAQAVAVRGEVRARVDRVRAWRDDVEAALASATAAGDRLAPTVGRLGVLGVADLARADDGVRLLAVDGGEGCVAPDEATVLDGRYPLARPALLVTTTRALARPAVRSVLTGYLRQVSDLAPERGLLPLPADRLDDQLATLDDAATPPTDVPPATVERPVW